jgi:hypothetical protein
MKTILKQNFGYVLILLLLSVSFSSKAVSCHPYIEQLPNGDVKFSVTLPAEQHYVEVFIRKDDIQTIAQNIVSSGVSNGNGTTTYSYIYPASNFVTGTKVTARFYSYLAGQPGVFTPGPIEGVWSVDFFYNQSCLNAIYVSTTGSDTNPGTSSSPVKTITKGISLASTAGYTEVRVATGTYVEGNIDVVNGINVSGGYSTDFLSYNIATYVTTIDAQQPGGVFVCGSKRIFRAVDITLPTRISGFTMTGGRLCGFGGGIYISNSSSNLVIQFNKITGNASVGNGSSAGGNLYIGSSAAKILNNEITNGFAGAGLGNDIYIYGTYGGLKSEIAYNTITSPGSIYGSSEANLHDNYFLNARVGVSEEEGNDHSNLYEPLEISFNDESILIHASGEEVETEVVNVSGRVIVKSNQTRIPTAGLRSGLYIVKAKTNSSTVTEKVLVR